MLQVDFVSQETSDKVMIPQRNPVRSTKTIFKVSYVCGDALASFRDFRESVVDGGDVGDDRLLVWRRNVNVWGENQRTGEELQENAGLWAEVYRCDFKTSDQEVWLLGRNNPVKRNVNAHGWMISAESCWRLYHWTWADICKKQQNNSWNVKKKAEIERGWIDEK